MNKYRSFSLVAMLLMGVVITSCGLEPADEAVSAGISDAELRVLADRYLHEQHETDEENQDLLAEIKRLSADDSYRLFETVDRLQLEAHPELTDEEARVRDLSRAINDYAYAHGVGLLHLSREQVHQVVVDHLGLGQDALDELNADFTPSTEVIEGDDMGTTTVLAASCSTGYVSCNTVSYTSVAAGGSCGSGCINGYSNDRFSNSMCEPGACDHRIFYPSASLEDAVYGETSLAYCVINYYGGFISRYSGGYTQLGFGILGPAWCGIWWDVGPYMRDQTQVF